MGKYTRRQFITSAGVGMAAVAGLGLAGCAPQTPADKAMANTGNGGTTFADTIAWDGEYDVVVIGFGGARCRVRLLRRRRRREGAAHR